MSETIFHPYSFAGGALNLEVHVVTVDGEEMELGPVPEGGRRTISLAGRAISDSVEVRARIRDPNQELNTTFEGGSLETDLRILLKASVADTRVRLVEQATQDATGAWEATLHLPAAALAGRVVLEPLAVRARDAVEQTGMANRKSEAVGDGPACVIYIDSPPPLPGGALDNEWVDFGAATSPQELRDRKDLVWYLDLANPDHPKLKLNEGVKGLKTALEAPQTIGRAARVRDALAHSIVQPVLLALAGESLSAWPPADEEPTYSWQKDLLILLAGQIGDASEGIKISRWRDEWVSTDRSRVYADLQTAIQRHLGVGHAASQLVAALEEASNG